MMSIASVLYCIIICIQIVRGQTTDEETPIVTTTKTTTTTSQASTSLPIVPVPPSTDKPCFNANKDLCPPTSKPNSHGECCPHPEIPTSLICCNVTDIKTLDYVGVPQGANLPNGTRWHHIHIINATLDELDLSNKHFKRLDSLSITDGNIKKITKHFTRISSMKCLNLTNNNIMEINTRALKDITLQELDLSFNNLSIMPNIAKNSQTNLTIDIRGNDGMLCKSLLESMSGYDFKDPDSTFCLTNKTFNWFNSTDRIPLRHLAHLKTKNLHSECPSIPGYGNCTCTAERMLYKEATNQWQFAAKVDCSRLGLIALPDKLPPSTLTLNVSNNNITTLEALSNESYKNLVRFYADDNQIRDIVDLEGTKFIEQFDSLHLRRNKLKTIPIYVLTNTFDRIIPSGKLMYLEGNKLLCDCNSVKVLRSWLLERQHNIVDYDKILCENVQQKILDLSEIKLCQSQHDWTDYIYYLISGEIILLVALVMKVSYDYWVFKTAGYLPWPASKMPKLPCDWLCES